MNVNNLKNENNLEALRGFAAIFVVFQHIISKQIDPNYHPSFLDAFIPPGNICVLVFFMLSGYVIGISNKRNLTSATIGAYIKKRIVRIYPIYFISMVLAVLVSLSSFSWFTTICNFTLLQGPVSTVLETNGPAWSLNYEVLYYLIFIPISYFNINPILIFFCSLLISAVNYWLFPQFNVPILSAYLDGLCFWILGLMIAKWFTQKDKPASPNLLVSNIFLILAMKSYHITSTVFGNLSMRFFKHYLVFPDEIYWAKTKVGFGDLMFLPYCFIFIATFADIDFRYKKIWMWVLQLIPIFCIYTFKHSYSPDLKIPIIVSSVYYIISTVLFIADPAILRTISSRLINAGKWLGSISYGIYIIHYPILILFCNALFFSGSPTRFFVRILVFLTLVISTSYLLEKRFQKWVRDLFYRA